MPIKNLISPLLILLLAVSCSMPQKRQRPLTQKEKALERYRLMRLQKWEKRKYRPKRVIIKPRPYTPPKPKIKMVDVKSQKIEIEQNMIYFCMVNRKESRFEQDNSCQQFTKSILDECMGSFIEGDARLTKCVKSRLN